MATKTRKVGREAIKGHFVSFAETKRHPDTTIVQTVKVGKRKPK